MRKIIIISLVILASFSAFGQQDAMYTNYMYNTLSVNPAYAGSRDALTLTALHRNQWIGYDGAPVTQTFTAHSPLMGGLGAGFSLVNDHIGPYKATSYHIDLSYRIKFEKTYLSFGLKGGVNTSSLDMTSFDPTTGNDPLLSGDKENYSSPNFGVGVYFHSDKYYMGLSVPGLLESTDNNLQQEALRHYFFIAGAAVDLNETVKFKPTTLVKVAPSSPVEVDLTASFVFKNTIHAGAMYRSGDAVGLLAGVNLTKQLLLGYSFDWSTTNKTGTYNDGSHELMLRYDFFFVSPKKIRSPRNF